MGRLVVHARRRTPFGSITIVRDTEDGSLRYCQGAVYQSIADRHGISLTAYTHAIASLIAQIPAGEILVIGCAGGTLGKLLDRRERRITLVDINATAFALARQFYDLPERIVCQVADGVQFVRETRERFDVIVVDVCDGTQLPAMFRALKFLRGAQQRLSKGGYLLCNVIRPDDADPTALKIAAKLAKEARVVSILDTPGVAERNAIIIAGPRPLRWSPRLCKRPEIGVAALREELRAMRMLDWWPTRCG
jgi:spermidine synthase